MKFSRGTMQWTAGSASGGIGGFGEVPVSNWALFIGIALILTFTVIRFRKLV